jgi:hypothetical protein
MQRSYASTAVEIYQNLSRKYLRPQQRKASNKLRSPKKILMYSASRILLLLTLLLAAAMISNPAEAEYRRSQKAKVAFKRENPCPATGRDKGSCPGYIIDHIVPLACGGADAPYNMQWQTLAAAKAKDKWERKGCAS